MVQFPLISPPGQSWTWSPPGQSSHWHSQCPARPPLPAPPVELIKIPGPRPLTRVYLDLVKLSLNCPCRNNLETILVDISCVLLEYFSHPWRNRFGCHCELHVPGKDRQGLSNALLATGWAGGRAGDAGLRWNWSEHGEAGECREQWQVAAPGRAGRTHDSVAQSSAELAATYL